MQHQPASSLESVGPIEYVIPGSQDDYLYSANTTRPDEFVRSRVVDMMVRLHVDLLVQDKTSRSKYDWYPARKHSLSWRVGPIQISHTESVRAHGAHQSIRQEHGRCAPSSIVLALPTGTRSHTHENLFFGILPKRFMLCCIDNDAYNGVYNIKPVTRQEQLHRLPSRLCGRSTDTLEIFPTKFCRRSG